MCSGSRRKVTENSRSPKSWDTFLTCDEKKTELFVFLSDQIVTVNPNTNIVVTRDGNVLNNTTVDIENLRRAIMKTPLCSYIQKHSYERKQEHHVNKF